MRGPKSPIKVVLTDNQRKELEELLQAKNTPLKLTKRIKAIFMLAEGHSISHINRTVSLQRRIVRKWAYRYLEMGKKGLYDAPRSGRPQIFTPEIEEKLLRIALSSPEKYGHSFRRWSCREIALQVINEGIIENISLETVRRILKKHDVNW